MTSRTRSRTSRGVALAAGCMLLIAAGGSDADESGTSNTAAVTTVAGSEAPVTSAGGETTVADTAAETTTAEVDTTVGGGDTTVAPDTTVGGPDTTAPAGSAGCPEVDESVDADWGDGTGRFLSDIQCSLDSPLAAEGEPIVVGFQNPEGDPNGSFPE